MARAPLPNTNWHHRPAYRLLGRMRQPVLAPSRMWSSRGWPIAIILTGNMLSLKGEFHADEEGERGTMYFRERRCGTFERSVVLPPGVDIDKLEATFSKVSVMIIR